MIRLFRIWRFKAQLHANLARRKIARSFRSQAAREGVSTSWRRRGERCRVVFGP